MNAVERQRSGSVCFVFQPSLPSCKTCWLTVEEKRDVQRGWGGRWRAMDALEWPTENMDGPED